MIPFLLPLIFTGLNHKSNKIKKPMPSFKDIIEIKHFIPGRIRYKIPHLIGNEKELKNLKKLLKSFDNIQKIEGSTITGSVLITYEKIEPSLITGILIHILNLKEAIDKPVTGRIHREFSSIISSLNRAIYEQSHGLLDINTITSLTLGTLGVTSLIRNPVKAPGAWTLLWWFYNTSTRMDRRTEKECNF